MASGADSLIVSPNICSLTDHDGTIILDTERDAIYSVIGLGSLIWKKLAACQSGLSFNTVVGELGAEFKDVPRQQIERDAERLLESFQQKRLVQQVEMNPGRFVHAKGSWTIAGFFLLSRVTMGLLPKLKLNTLAAFLGLATINLMLKVVGFRALYQSVKRWPISNNRTRPEAEQEVCDAVNRATTICSINAKISCERVCEHIERRPNAALREAGRAARGDWVKALTNQLMMNGR